MPFQVIDWLVVLIPIIVLILVGYSTQKYVKGVSDFMAAGRVVGHMNADDVADPGFPD